MSLVSVIVPVYNTESYLDRCIDSLLSQTHREIEILIIDDGSTDSSGAICDGFAARDDRVRVFHLENGGVSRARNFGIEQSSGDFIAFVDSDDWLENVAIEKELNTLCGSGSDMAIFSILFYDGKNSTSAALKNGVYSPSEYLCDEGQNLAYLCSPCNKIYKSSVIKENDARFTEGVKFGEDFIFNSKCLASSKIVAVSSNAYYYYDMSREESGVKRLYREYDDFIVAIDNAFRTMLSRLCVPDGKVRTDFMAERWDYAFSVCINSNESIEEKTKILTEWLRKIPEGDLSAFCAFGGAVSALCNARFWEKDFTEKTVERALKKYLSKGKFRKALAKIKGFFRRKG